MSSLFPELDDRMSHAADAHADDERARPFVELRLGPDDKALAASAWGIDKLQRLFGLGEAPRITAARLMLGDGHLEVVIEGEPVGRIVLLLRPCQPSEACPDDFRILLHGPVRNEPVKRLIERAQRRLHRAPYRTLIKALRADPGRQVVTGRSSAELARDEEFERSVVRTPRGSSAWRIFFAELEQQRNFNYHLAGNIQVLRHEDLECFYATPCVGNGTISFFNYPAAHRQERAERPEPTRRLPIVAAKKWGDVITDLTDRDVIHGGTQKLERALAVLAEGPELPDLVLVKIACVPKVVGDELGEAMRRFEAKTGVPTVFLDNLAGDESDFFSTILERLRLEPEHHAPAERAGRINLVGFPDEPEMDRLIGLLEGLGVTINARLVPEVRLEDIKRYDWAELQVLMDTRLYSSSYERLFGNVDLRALRTPPPFGVEGTRRWLESVLDALGMDTGALGSTWEKAWEPFRERWATLREQALGKRFGFVVDRTSAERLVCPERGAGVPMLAMLDEMGFETEILFYAGDGSKPPPELSARSETFEDADSLERALESSRAQAFYSEYFFDRRLTRTGKAQLAPADFRLGLGGALWTLERLLRISETTFYRRYASYLGSAFGAPAWSRHV